MKIRIGVIASMKKGLEHFIFRELTIFSGHDVSISLFPSKYQPGHYQPAPEWQVYRWHPLIVLAMQPYFLLRAPRRYLHVLRVGMRYHALVEAAIAWYFSRHMSDIDVIYATFGDRKFFIGYFCKQILDRPLAVMIHAYELYQNPNPRLFIEALNSCDRIITVTDYNKALLVDRYALDPQRIDVVRISVDTDHYRPRDTFVILMVASFAERKGHEILFQAVAQLKRDDIEVWVVGDEGTETAVDVRAMVARFGIASQVAFFGQLSGTALEAVYRACDVFCLPCRTDSAGVAEGFPTVLAEAMAFGKPVITTRHVEIPQVVEQILVDENDVDGIAEAIALLSQSASIRAEMGERNRTIAVQYFSARNALRTVSLLRSLGDGNG